MVGRAEEGNDGGGTVIDRRKLLATAALALCAALAGCGSDDGPERVESVPALGFVERFAPLVHVHDNEQSHPMPATFFIDHSMLLWSDGGFREQVALASGKDRQGIDRDPHPLLTAGMLGEDPGYDRKPRHPRPNCPSCGDLTYLTVNPTRPFDVTRPPELRLREAEGYYLDLLTNFLRGRRKMTRDGNQAVMSRVPVYTEVVEEPEDKPVGLRVTYWMLFGVNEPSVSTIDYHEGDWERISVFLRRTDSGARYEPKSVRYYQYDGFEDVAWDSVSVVSRPGEDGASHPEVFLSKGDHTPFPDEFRGKRRFKSSDGRPIELPQDARSCPRCPQWRTWNSLVNADTEPWYGFGGAWGLIGTEEANTGPRGPSVWTGEPAGAKPAS